MRKVKDLALQGLSRSIHGIAGTGKISPVDRALGIGLVGLFCIFLVPTAFVAEPGFGLEASWRCVLNWAVSQRLVFGTQLIWPYGPLGFLEGRIPYGVSPYYYLGFDVLILGAFLLFARDVVRLNFDKALAVGCCAALLVSKKVINDTAATALYCLLVFLVIRNMNRLSVVGSAGFVVVSVVMFFLKMNFGLVGLVLSLFVFTFRALRRDRTAYVWLLLVVLEVLLAWALSGPLHTNLPAYIKNSLALIGEYGDGMLSGPGRGSISHVAVCATFAAFILLSLVVLREQRFGREPFEYLAVAGIAIFVLFKTAIVRSDYLHHNKCFLFGFPLIALALLVHAPERLGRIWRPLFIGSAAYAALLLVVEHGAFMIYTSKDTLKAFFPIDYVREIANYGRHANWADFAESVNRTCSERSVPENVRAIVGTNSIDVFPFEATLPLSSSLNYRPRPVPQSYAALGKDLEGANLAFYRSAEAPRYVLYVLGQPGYSIDTRYHLWEEPAMKRLLRDAYTPCLTFTNLQGVTNETPPLRTPVLLLERSQDPTLYNEVPLFKKMERAGREFEIPKVPEELYAKIRIRKTLLGRVVSFLYRGGVAKARFRLEEGTTKEFRVIPANLGAGVLVNSFAEVDAPEATLNYLRGRSFGNPKCLGINIGFERSWLYKSEFEVNYFCLEAKGQQAK